MSDKSSRELGKNPRLSIAFPKSDTELILIFSEPVDRATAERTESYSTENGLKILAATVDSKDPKRVKLTTERMMGDAMREDVMRAVEVRTVSGQKLSQNASPRFIQGIASITETQIPHEWIFPFNSRYHGFVMSMSCQKNGGVDSSYLIDLLGFSFLHRETGGTFHSIKVVGNKHVPGITAEVARLSPQGLTPHVLWAGGQIQNNQGETQLVDTGFMEGSIIPWTPKKKPPATKIKTNEISRESGNTLKAKSLQGVIVSIDNVEIDRVSAANERGLRSFAFHDDSDAEVSGLLLGTVTQNIQAGQKFKSIRGIVHQPKPDHYEVIVELDEHLSGAEIRK